MRPVVAVQADDYHSALHLCPDRIANVKTKLVTSRRSKRPLLGPPILRRSYDDYLSDVHLGLGRLANLMLRA